MKTDYGNLNTFDCALIVTISIGVIILGAIVYLALPPQAQQAVADSLVVFDASQLGADSVEHAIAAVALTREYMDEFTVAFAQVASLPSDFVDRPVSVIAQMTNSVAAYSESLAGNYSAVVSEVAYGPNVYNSLTSDVIIASALNTHAGQGTVLGVSKETGNSANGSKPVKKFYVPYSYSKPDLSMMLKSAKFINKFNY